MDIVMPNAQASIVQEMILNCHKERTIWIKGEIDEDMAFIFNRVAEKIFDMDVKSGEKNLVLHVKIDSPGGDVTAMFSIMSQIESLKEFGYKIIGTGYGKVMSGGLFILMACSKRFAQRYTRFLFHSILAISISSVDTIESSRRNIRDLEELWDMIRMLTKKYTKITDEFLDSVTDSQRDYFFFPEKAIELGIIDHII